jgi:hypothetical protein
MGSGVVGNCLLSLLNKFINQNVINLLLIIPMNVAGSRGWGGGQNELNKYGIRN